MKITKLIMLGLTVSTVAALASAAHADQFTNPDGTQTIENSTDPIVTEADCCRTWRSHYYNN